MTFRPEDFERAARRLSRAAPSAEEAARVLEQFRRVHAKFSQAAERHFPGVRRPTERLQERRDNEQADNRTYTR